MFSGLHTIPTIPGHIIYKAITRQNTMLKATPQVITDGTGKPRQKLDWYLPLLWVLFKVNSEVDTSLLTQ